MGASKGADVEKASLLTAPDHTVYAEEIEAAAETPETPIRKWNGSLLACCGACDFVGLGSCLLSKYLPCLAYGQNAKRAFKQSAWLHGLTYLALFMVVGWLSLAFLLSANHNVLAQCNGELPAPPKDSFWMQMAHDQTTDSLDWGSDTLSFRGLGEDEDDDDDDNDDDHHHHHHESDGSDGDHGKHPDHHSHKDGEKHGKKPCKGKKDKVKDTQAAVAGGQGDTFKAVSDFATRKMGPGFAHDGPAYHGPDRRSPEELLASPECHEAVMVYCGAWLAMSISVLLAVVYAARRRSMLRERFGIAGSKLGDFCTWCWCAPCALCQETRTLWTNNVHDGVWHGVGPYSPLPTPATVPQGQFMTANV